MPDDYAEHRSYADDSYVPPSARERLLVRARYLGVDAALANASCTLMSEAEATDIVYDPEYFYNSDEFAPPDLSGEWAGDPTPNTLYREVTADRELPAMQSGHDMDELTDAIAAAWEAGRDEVWQNAMLAVAYRTLGKINDALRLENENEWLAEKLRVASS